MTQNRAPILISGGTGLIGRRLVTNLTRDGYPVVVLTRRPDQVRDLPPGARPVGWDAETTEGWGELVDEALGVVQLAGESVAEGRWTEEKKRRIRDSRIDSSRAISEAIAKAGTKPRFLVQASAVGYYGSRGDQILTEDAAPGDDFLAGVSLEWEAATARVETLGVRRPVVRTGIVLDPEEGALAKMLPPFKLGLGGPLGSGRHFMPWIHLDDEVRAIRFLIEKGDATGPYNLTAPHPVRNRELAEALGRVLHRPAWIPTPKLALYVLFGEMAEILLASQRAVPHRLTEAGFTFRFSEIEPALRDLLE